MEVCVNSYISRYHTVDNRIKELESTYLDDDAFAKGSICVLNSYLQKVSAQLKSFECFLRHVPLPQLENMLQFLTNEEVVDNSATSTETDEEIYLRLANCDHSEDDKNDDDEDDENDETIEGNFII